MRLPLSRWSPLELLAIAVLLAVSSSAPSSFLASAASVGARERQDGGAVKYRIPSHLLRKAASILRASSMDGDFDAAPLEYDDFSDSAPPFLRNSYVEMAPMTGKRADERLQIRKRVLGIDIPDYIASGGGGRSDALKSMSQRMKALGRKRR